MKSLNKVKLVAFDFDDTLFAHNIHQIDYPYDKIMYFVKCLQSTQNARKDLWGKCSTNSVFEEFMNYCEKQDIVMGLISWTGSSICASEKVNYVKEQYHHKIKNWCVGSIEEKIQMLKALAKFYCLDAEQILIIDDNLHVLTDANMAGFQCSTPIAFVNFWNDLKQK